STQPDRPVNLIPFGPPVFVMRRHRTTARGILLLAATLGLAAGTAGAAPPKVPEHIVFPVVGQVRYSDDFGAPRPGGVVRRLHALPVRRERHDLLLHPPEQRPDDG